MPRQIYLADDVAWATLKAFPTCFAFSRIKLNKWCLCMFAVKKSWFHGVIIPDLFKPDAKLIIRKHVHGFILSYQFAFIHITLLPSSGYPLAGAIFESKLVSILARDT